MFKVFVNILATSNGGDLLYCFMICKTTALLLVRLIPLGVVALLLACYIRLIVTDLH